MNGRLTSLLKRRESGVLLAVVAVIAVTTIINPKFLFSASGASNLLLTPSILAVLAVAQTFVIVTKNIDLSVSAVLGLTAFATGTMFEHWQGVPAAVVTIIAVAFGGLLGLLNGVLISAAKVPALVITLGTLYAYRGAQVIWQGSSLITPNDMPDDFTNIGAGAVLGLPFLTIAAVLVVIGAGYYLGYRRSGREFYAIGSDDQAARLYGLPVSRRILTAFVLSGLLSGLAGVMYAARYATVASSAGTGLELQAVAAAVIGGVAIFGGSGTPVGAVLGAVLLTTINSTLPTIGVQDFWQQAVVGALIILAIVLDRVLAVRSARRLTAADVPVETVPQREKATAA